MLGDAAMRTAVLDLGTSTAALIHTLIARTGGPEPDHPTMMGLELLGVDGGEVAIDELEPALRAAIRILLSLIAGQRRDAIMQLDLVGGSAEPMETGAVLVHMLMWTVQLTDLADELNIARPITWTPAGAPRGTSG
jgi:hypothetical protein